MSIIKLIERLASDARPVRRSAFLSIVWPSLLIGTLCGFVVMVMSIGIRPDIGQKEALAQIMVRGGLGAASVIAGLAALVSSLRPDISSTTPKRILAAALALIVIFAAVQLTSDKFSWSLVYLGASARCSPWMVALFAVPSFVSLATVVRFEAPTHLNVSGAALGLTSGGIGAFVYGFGCSEESAAVGLVWFSVGIGLTTLVGMLIGPRLLRW